MHGAAKRRLPVPAGRSCPIAGLPLDPVPHVQPAGLALVHLPHRAVADDLDHELAALVPQDARGSSMVSSARCGGEAADEEDARRPAAGLVRAPSGR